jgi:uncharacterized membrane protein YccC
MTRLMALLNQANLVAEAATALNQEGNRPPPPVTDAIDAAADAISGGRPPADAPGRWGDSPGATALHDAMAGVSRLLSGKVTPPANFPATRPPLRDRLGAAVDRVSGRLSQIFAVRLMASIGVAAMLSEVLPLRRSYWVVLTVAIVLKPDFGSVFARAVQRGLGTIIGAVLGAVILALVPYGPWLLIPFGVLAVLLPYGQSRNYGLFATFLTPLAVVLIDLVAATGWHLALDRLLDTVLGCAVVLLVGYAPWPTSWQAHLPGQFAQTIRKVSRYLDEALVTAWAAPDGAAAAGAGAAGPGNEQAAGPEREAGPYPRAATKLPARSRLRRDAYRALADLRAEFQRTMSEPAAVSRRATAWWPALVGLEEVVDAITATAVAIAGGAPAPASGAVGQLSAALASAADRVAGVAQRPELPELPPDGQLKPVTEAVRAVLCVLATGKPSAQATVG